MLPVAIPQAWNSLPTAVIFNRDSAEPKDSASGIQGFRGTAGAPTFAATRRVF